MADDPCEAASWPVDPTGASKYYRARYYDPKIGRFISEDPIGFAAGVNFYGYVGDNPTNRTDPSGLWWSHVVPAHSYMLDAALSPSLTPEQMELVKTTNVTFDDSTQMAYQAYVHAMRPPGAGLATAHYWINNFIEDRLAVAILLEKNGAHDAALAALTEGMHTLMDMSSPAHGGCQVWKGEAASKREILVHLAREAWPTQQQFDYTVSVLRNYYSRFVAGSQP